jgi:3',5'-cyclic AMP phosphodiesterase CpdA
MPTAIDRRTLLRLGFAGLGGIVLVPALGRLGAGAEPGGTPADGRAQEEFYFVQLSDVHLGFNGPKVNPDAEGTLAKAIAAVNALEHPPEFVIFTGDLTHLVEDETVRRTRMAAFKAAAGQLKAKAVHFMPGEHDASLDRGAIYQQVFGPLRYAFDVGGVHFIALDNVSDPGAIIGAEQLDWLKADLARQPADARIVVFAHRPLFDLYPQWDWHTRDGQAVIDALLPFANVTVFYGHIHQEHHHATGHIQHHSARSLMFALPAPGSVPKKAPVPWDPAAPYAGLGFREVEAQVAKAEFTSTERPVVAR